jgi:hypothetical protein
LVTTVTAAGYAQNVRLNAYGNYVLMIVWITVIAPAQKVILMEQ